MNNHHNWDLRIAVKDVRQRMVNNYEVNKEFGVFLGVETFIFSGLATYIGVTFFEWSGFATFILSFLAMMIIIFSSFYSILALVFSVGWAYLGYTLLNTISVYLGGNDFVASIIGVVGFLLAFFISSSIRNGDKPVFS